MNFLLQRKLRNFYILYYLVKFSGVLKRAKKDPTAWIAAQNKSIRKFVPFIYQIPFYRKRFDEAGISPDAIQTREDFTKLPPLTKKEYRDWILSEMGDEKRFKYWAKRRTTGSTGTPLDLLAWPKDNAAEIANLFRCALLQDAGFNPFFDTVFSTMVPRNQPQKKRLVLNNIKMSSILPPEELCAGYNEIKPDFYYGNKTAILSIARYALEHGIKLHRPKCVGSISEVLDDNARRIINEAFGEGVLFDIFGCSETGNFAADRASEPKKHVIWNDTHAVNVVDAQEVRPGVFIGKLSMTSLIHHGFPVVNYLVGDTVELTVENGVPYITGAVGRSNDTIKNSDGTSFEWMHVSSVMHGINDIAQFRVIQNSYSELTFVIAATNLSEERKREIEEQIRSNAVRFFGPLDSPKGKNVTFEWTDRIPPDPTGKIRMLISNVQ